MKSKVILFYHRGIYINCCLIIIISLFSFNKTYSQNKHSNFKIDSLRAVVNTTKGNFAAVRAYIGAFQYRYESDTLKNDIDRWMKQYPDSLSFPLAYGDGLFEIESPKALPYLKRASELNPKNPDIWATLAIEAERWGDNDLANQYRKRAADLAPDNYEIQYSYASGLKSKDKEQSIKMIYELSDRFRNEERGATALSMLGYNLTDPNEKIKVWEKLRADYPPLKNFYSAVAMFRLVDVYLQKGYFDKAIEISDPLRSVKEYQRLQFETRYQLANEMKEIQNLSNDKKREEALSRAEKLKLPSNFEGPKHLIIFVKANIYAQGGDVKRAYDSLVVAQSKRPDDILLDAINNYGAQIGKNKQQQISDIREARIKASVIAVPFELEMYTGESKFKLADNKGKVILLTFWFPGCGPCRAEMPHFENALKKIDRKNFVFIGVNSVRSQDAYVNPFVKNNKVTFIPLKGTREISKDYNIIANPTNFLIDKEGRIAYSDFMIGSDNERMLELMINTLLAE